jgi:hypothetical protein
VVFVADRDTVPEDNDRCAHVGNGAILVTRGTVDGDAHGVHIGVSRFVACLGATWLTYMVDNHPGPWINS